MEEKQPKPLTEEELAQVRKALEDFGSVPFAPVIRKEEAEQQAQPKKTLEAPKPAPVKKRRVWIVYTAAVLVVALVLGIGCAVWAAKPENHPNSMAKRKQTITAGSGYAAISRDGTVSLENVNWLPTESEWKNMVSIDMSGSHIVGLREDGTVRFSGSGYCGEECTQWTNMTAVAAGSIFTVGLRADGTVIAAGRNDHGQCDVSEWTDIIGIDAGCYFTAGLRSDGTVLVTQIQESSLGLASTTAAAEMIEQTNAFLRELTSELEEVRQWENIIAISVGDAHLLGLKEDGTVVAAGINEYGRCDVDDWTGILSIDASTYISVGVRFDGTIAVAGTMRQYVEYPGILEDTQMEQEATSAEELLRELTAPYEIVAACSDGSGNPYFLCVDGTLYGVSYVVLSGIGFGTLTIREILTDVSLP